MIVYMTYQKGDKPEPPRKLEPFTSQVRALNTGQMAEFGSISHTVTLHNFQEVALVLERIVVILTALGLSTISHIRGSN